MSQACFFVEKNWLVWIRCGEEARSLRQWLLWGAFVFGDSEDVFGKYNNQTEAPRTHGQTIVYIEVWWWMWERNQHQARFVNGSRALTNSPRKIVVSFQEMWHLLTPGTPLERALFQQLMVKNQNGVCQVAFPWTIIPIPPKRQPKTPQNLLCLFNLIKI